MENKSTKEKKTETKVNKQFQIKYLAFDLYTLDQCNQLSNFVECLQKGVHFDICIYSFASDTLDIL